MILLHSTNIDKNHLNIEGDEHLHCVKVLRIKIGDTVFVTDGKGNKYKCKVQSVSKLFTHCEIITTSYTPLDEFKNCIAIAPTKNISRIEWFVEKAVEIGVHEIIILVTHRTEKKNVNLARLNKIMISAMKQSLHYHLPLLTLHSNIVSMNDEIINKYEQKFIAWCNGPTDILSKYNTANTNNILLIGPEGDFTKDEIDICQKSGYRSVSLGDSRLRTETAALVGLMMLRISC